MRQVKQLYCTVFYCLLSPSVLINLLEDSLYPCNKTSPKETAKTVSNSQLLGRCDIAFISIRAFGSAIFLRQPIRYICISISQKYCYYSLPGSSYKDLSLDVSRNAVFELEITYI